MQPISRTGRTIEKELFIAAEPERVYEALTTQAGLEAWFVTRAEIDPRPGGVFNVWFKTNHVPGEIVHLDPPRQMVFTWDDGPKYGVTTCVIEILPESNGSRLRLTHTGFGDGENWDELYEGINNGWVSELDNLKNWVETGTPKTW